MSDTQTALRGAALATAGLAAASLLSARSAQAQTATYAPAALYFSASPGTGAVVVPNTSKNFTTGSTDVQVLNFALALETLEAELYRQAVLRLTTGGTDMFGNTITGLGVTGKDVTYLTEFTTVEAQHRDFLTGALGNNWVTDANGRFDFGFADTNNFGTPALTRLQTVELVYAAELTGVSAYLGGAGVLTPGSKNLTYAAAILGTEARHTTAVAIILNGPPYSLNGALKTAPLAGDNAGKDTPLVPDQILNQGGTVPADLTPDGSGKISPVSGKNGFGGKGFVFLPSTGTTITLP